MAYFCSAVSGASTGRLQGGGLESPEKSSSFTCLTVMLAIRGGLSASPGGLVWASLQHSYWVPRVPWEKREEARWRLCYRLWPSLTRQALLLWLHFGHWGSHKVLLNFERRKHGLHLLVGSVRFYKGMWDWKSCRDHFWKTGCHSWKNILHL